MEPTKDPRTPSMTTRVLSSATEVRGRGGLPGDDDAGEGEDDDAPYRAFEDQLRALVGRATPSGNFRARACPVNGDGRGRGARS